MTRKNKASLQVNFNNLKLFQMKTKILLTKFAKKKTTNSEKFQFKKLETQMCKLTKNLLMSIKQLKPNLTKMVLDLTIKTSNQIWMVVNKI